MKKVLRIFICYFLLLFALVQTALGSTTELFTTSDTLMEAGDSRDSCVQETVLGDYCADAIRGIAGTDIAILPGSFLSGDIPKGRVSETQLSAVFSSNAEILISSVSPAQLREILEDSVSHIATGADERIDCDASAYDGFLQISGFAFKYDASALPGNRVKQIVLSGDSVLDMEDAVASLTLAFPMSPYPSSVNMGGRESGIFLEHILFDYAQTQEGIHNPEGSRISIVGNNPSLFDEHLSFPLLLGIILLLALIRLLFPKHFRYDDGLPE